jgi:Ca2+-binding EF-hand superfamily protein
MTMQISSATGGFSALRALPSEEQRKQQFLKADTDGSGGLSVEEFEQLGPPPELAKLGGSGPSAKDLFKRFDRDGNGELTQTEIDDGKPKFDSASLSVVIQLQSVGDTDADLSLAKLLEDSEAEKAEKTEDASETEPSTLVERLQDIQSILLEYLSKTSSNFTLRNDGGRSQVG